MILSVFTKGQKTGSLRDSLSLKLIILFCISFLIAFLSLWTYDVFASAIQYQIAASNLTKPTVITIDPKLEKDLAKVMEFNSTQDTVDIKNPFSDTQNLSSLKGVPMVASLSNTASGNSDNSTNSGTVAQPTKIPEQATSATKANQSSSNKRTNDQNETDSTNSPKLPTEDTLTRIIRRNERIRLGLSVNPEAMVFAIDDLLPVGVVSGGDEKKEVMFYSQSLQRTLSFPIGTRFYDGWLVAFNTEGSVFTSSDEFQRVRVKSWARNLNSEISPSSSLLSPRRTLSFEK